jgi:hypothetical protein
MSWQLIYTSAPRGLAPGQSGFCTVARSPDLRDALAQRLEQLSSYHYLEMPSAERSVWNPTISAYRILDIRGSKFHALSRIQPCGLDFTARTNHLAQHLVFSAEELATLPSPAALLRNWQGWRSVWQEEPHVLEPLTPGDFSNIPRPSWPARIWQRTTGDAGRAAALLEGECARGCYLLCRTGGEQELLELFDETLQLPNWTGKYPARAWQYTFTTFLQAQDAAADFLWRGCQQHTPGWEQAMRFGARMIELKTIAVPNNPLAKLAREGPKIPSPSPVLRGSNPAPGRESVSALRPASLPAASTEAIAGKKSKWDGVEWYKGPAPYTPPDWLKAPWVKTVGIAVVLLLGVIVLRSCAPSKRKMEQARAERAAALTSPGATPAPPQPTTTSSGPAPTTNPPSSPPEPVLGQSQMDRLHQFHWEDAPIFLVSAPSFEEPIPLPPIEHLQDLLSRYDKLELFPANLQIYFNSGEWGFFTKYPVRVDPRGSGPECKLAARANPPTGAEVNFSFDLPRSADGSSGVQPIRLQAACSDPLKSFSLLFARARSADSKTPFSPFRLLVVNQKNPPQSRPLPRGFLKPNARHAPQDLQAPLATSLNQFHLPADLHWCLHPYVGGGRLSGYLFRGWGPEKPADDLDLKAAQASLNKSLEGLTNQINDVDNQITSQSSSTQPLNLSVKLGHFLQLTNRELASIEAYTNHLTADGYLDYLDLLKKHSEHKWMHEWTVHRGARDEVISGDLNELYEHFKKHVPEHELEKLTVSGATTNYFLAEWKNLTVEREINKLQRSKQEKQNKMIEMKDRLKDVRNAYLSLCLELGHDRWLEVIRFSED